jgi:DinB superfamily
MAATARWTAVASREGRAQEEIMVARKKPGKRAAKPRSKSVPARAANRSGQSLREHLLYLLKGGGAHADFEKVIADVPEEVRGAKPEGQPFTPWRLLEHMRIAQRDILEFSRNPKHASPPWPDGYWPETDAPPGAKAWERSVSAFRADLKAMQRLIEDPHTDLYAPLAHGDGQTILREALLLADHNAYHLGQLVLLRRLAGSWQD